MPFGVEILGSWGPSVKSFFKDISKKLFNVTHDRKTGFYFSQQISIAIQHDNAARHLGKLPSGSNALYDL